MKDGEGHREAGRIGTYAGQKKEFKEAAGSNYGGHRDHRLGCGGRHLCPQTSAGKPGRQ
jgi:hypothetical protein